MPCWFVSPCSLTFLRRHGPHRNHTRAAAAGVFNAVHIVTGIRRCGKTFYLFQKIHDLLQNGVSRNDIFYFNFADDRLQPMQDTVLNDIVTEYWRQYPDSRDHGCYLFLDEVQECANWQGFCQRIAEHEAVTLVITGSSSETVQRRNRN